MGLNTTNIQTSFSDEEIARYNALEAAAMTAKEKKKAEQNKKVALMKVATDFADQGVLVLEKMKIPVAYGRRFKEVMVLAASQGKTWEEKEYLQFLQSSITRDRTLGRIEKLKEEDRKVLLAGMDLWEVRQVKGDLIKRSLHGESNLQLINTLIGKERALKLALKH
jgi:hypothetical protein